jgi:hypothetical protein
MLSEAEYSQRSTRRVAQLLLAGLSVLGLAIVLLLLSLGLFIGATLLGLFATAANPTLTACAHRNLETSQCLAWIIHEAGRHGARRRFASHDPHRPCSPCGEGW